MTRSYRGGGRGRGRKSEGRGRERDGGGGNVKEEGKKEREGGRIYGRS